MSPRREYHEVQGAYPSSRPSAPDPFLDHLRAVVKSQSPATCGTLSPFGALPCALPPDHLDLCRDRDRTKAWPGRRCPGLKVEVDSRGKRRSWRCKRTPHAPDVMHTSGPGGGRRWYAS